MQAHRAACAPQPALRSLQRSLWYDRGVSDTLLAEPVPTLALAEKAAESAASHPFVEQILLFGSVARKDAEPGSDIDLLVLLSDVTDEERAQAESFVRSQIRETLSLGVLTDVIVNRRSTYEHMRREVTASFEHAISDDAVVLYQSTADLPPTSCSIKGVPRNNFGLAVDRFSSSVNSLNAIARHLGSVEQEEQRLAGSDPEDLAITRRGRYAAVLQDAHMVMEQALQAVHATSGGKALKSHNLDELLEQMSKDGRAVVAPALDMAREDSGCLRNWRVSSYLLADPGWQKVSTAENVSAHVAAAVRLGRRVHRFLVEHPSNEGSRERELARCDAVIATLEATSVSAAAFKHGGDVGAVS